jgi:hypothetical protein
MAHTAGLDAIFRQGIGSSLPALSGSVAVDGNDNDHDDGVGFALSFAPALAVAAAAPPVKPTRLAAYDRGTHADSHRNPRLPNAQNTVGQPYAAMMDGDDR